MNSTEIPTIKFSTISSSLPAFLAPPADHTVVAECGGFFATGRTEHDAAMDAMDSWVRRVAADAKKAVMDKYING